MRTPQVARTGGIEIDGDEGDTRHARVRRRSVGGATPLFGERVDPRQLPRAADARERVVEAADRPRRRWCRPTPGGARGRSTGVQSGHADPAAPARVGTPTASCTSACETRVTIGRRRIGLGAHRDVAAGDEQPRRSAACQRRRIALDERQRRRRRRAGRRRGAAPARAPATPRPAARPARAGRSWRGPRRPARRRPDRGSSAPSARARDRRRRSRIAASSRSRRRRQLGMLLLDPGRGEGDRRPVRRWRRSGRGRGLAQEEQSADRRHGCCARSACAQRQGTSFSIHSMRIRSL